MITSRKNRLIDTTKPVLIYRNLNNGLLSIKQGGLVMGYTDDIVLSDVEFIVNEAGRQRVLQEKRKNVHAFLKGYIVTNDGLREHIKLSQGVQVFYNPYKVRTFVTAQMEPVLRAGFCRVDSSGKMEAYR